MNNLVLNEFRDYLVNLGRKPLTIKKHLYWIQRITADCPNETLEEVLSFLEKKKLTNSNNGLNVIIESIRCYAQFRGLKSWLESVKYYKRDTSFERGILSDDEVEKILKLKRPKKMWKKSWEMYMMAIRIMLYTGLRPREACTLSVEDIDFGLGIITLKPENAKTNGTIPIPDTLRPFLEAYIASSSTPYLFPSVNNGYGGTIGTNALDEFWKKLLIMVGIKRPHITPYSCRHTFGTRLGDEDVNMKTIKDLMRHSKITTTEIYLHPSYKTLKKAQTKIPYISKNTKSLEKLKMWEESINLWEIDKDPRFMYTFSKTQNSLDIHIQIKKKFLTK